METKGNKKEHCLNVHYPPDCERAADIAIIETKSS